MPGVERRKGVALQLRGCRALSRGVPARHVRSRFRDGNELSSVEGWYVLAQANRTFAFDGWNRETIETKCIMGREMRSTSAAVYAARVRITVHIADRVIVRDGHGTGEATGQSVGEVHDRALKAAETDATKRALATFGRAFGLALYAPMQSARRKHGNGSHADRADHPIEAASSMAQLRVTEPAAIGIALEEGGTANGTAAPKHVGGSTPSIERRIDKSTLVLDEPRRLRDKDHLRYVAAQPCLAIASGTGRPHQSSAPDRPRFR